MEINFTPEDNVRLANLCGALDENLKQIEDALEVGIARRGGHFRLSGETDNMRLAAQLLQDFYQRARKPIGLEDVQLGLVEVGKLSTEAFSTASMPVLMTRRSDLHGRTPRQIDYLQQIQDFDITFGIGPAGTGKTYLAVASAVDALSRDRVKRIVLVRPAVEAGERLGFLPGDLSEKVDPYMAPVWEALTDILGVDQFRRRREKGEIELAPIAFMRGRTLSHAYVIVDEAKNCSRLQMKMVLTRLGEGARMVVTGDPSQIDLPRAEDSGLAHAVGLLEGVKGVGVNRFAAEDVVRHPLVERIVRAYEADSAKSRGKPERPRFEKPKADAPETDPS
ncbi:PhoH-like protein [mine drainage metagenome]|uniref:PhoH-like protein n=1 Tax=mine drainage metagenome TaxID=410659 RepID=A0A1J5Q1V0_9ZZZZ